MILYSAALRLDLSAPQSTIDSLMTAFSETALSAGAKREDGWLLTWFFDYAPDPNELAHVAGQTVNEDFPASRWSIETVPDVNWLEQSYRQFEPFTVGDFYIHGSHCAPKNDRDAISLQIDAATAFGSGEHPTTAGCLEVLSSLKRENFTPASILDMGTGSGILAIAAAKLWPKASITACDIDDEAVTVTLRHAAMNNVRFSAFCGDGFHAPELSGRRFDLVIANILAGSLIAMAPDAAAKTAPGGFVVLSGILDECADDVIAAYQDSGFSLVKNNAKDGWRILTMRQTP